MGVYAGEDDGLTLTIKEDCVTLPLDDSETLQARPGQTMSVGNALTCCGMQDGTLHLLARILNSPFTLNAACRFDGDKVKLTLGGVGPKAETRKLTKKD